MNKAFALIVDDEPDILELLSITLERMGVMTERAETVAEAREALKKRAFDFCLTDMRLPDDSGISLVEHVGQSFPDMPIAMITAHGNTETAVKALKAGAFDFVSKPVDLEQLRNLVNTALKLSSSKVANDDNNADHTADSTRLIGDSDEMTQLRELVVKLSRSQAPVLIHGESGTGKELVARMIHQHSPRNDNTFVAVNCGAIPGELMESEFFGHLKGSFTGAHRDNPGLFRSAEGGTLFLDEIAELPLHMQVKLLRAIQEKAVRPVGSSQEIPINVRILSASHADLAQKISQREFRQDLYYRLNVIELKVPSLRQRKSDIPELASHLLQRIAASWGVSPPKLSEQGLKALQAYSFPGNVRELENLLERALTLSDGLCIQAADLHFPDHAPGTSDNGRPQSMSLDDYLQAIEVSQIQQALEATMHNKTKAADYLGISFRALRYKLKKYGMEN